MKPLRLSRRACLRGLGVSLALPGLEAMLPRVARAQAAAPLRFLCVFSPNGYLMNKWTPTSTGTGWATPPLMTALEPFREDFSILSGLGNYTASIASRFGGSHTRATGSLLTQCPIAFSAGNGVRNGISVDQVIAKQIGKETRFPSLQVGARAGSTTGDCEDSYSLRVPEQHLLGGADHAPAQAGQPARRLQPAVRRRRPGRPMPAPAERQGSFYGSSILDVVNTRADALRQRLGKTDKHQARRVLQLRARGRSSGWGRRP